MKWFLCHKWLTAVGVMIAFFTLFQAGRSFFSCQEHRIRHRLHQAVLRKFPEAAQALADRQGIRPCDRNHKRVENSGLDRVILVHGLDDPGIIWDNLVPILQENRFEVLIMSYPNDQAIEASTRFFFDQMQQLAKKAPGPVSVVTHSMGGLVARDMLTRPEFDYTGAASAKKVPAVNHLIMVAPPSHGTQMARFRIFTEIKDQIYQIFTQDTHWLHCLLDGTGAAAVDLLPGSRFLTRLNQQPLPKNIQMHVIAGMIFPGSDDSFVKNIVGDGLVSVNSARLKTVPLTRVPGSHFTVIRNLTLSSTRIPPAIPVIIRLLKSG
ncbi:MAG: alpha/beta hydrolase [Desulfotignum sp.]|nr:alpha/beta hydrolase [Desulfotignum sp.]MCF8112527.1 alpha/beta hydrolase [Desulfotignum sp.]MCF8124733.1 alpha/beta hydrolase [Desulfotignum sp.]